MGAETANTTHRERYPLRCSVDVSALTVCYHRQGARPSERSSMSDATCSVPRCPGKVDARGWCGGHYRRWRKTGDVQADVPLAARLPKGTPCTIKDCGKPQLARGWCMKHYRLWSIYGSPEDRPRYVKPSSGIYPPGSKVPHEWVMCPTCDERALVRIGGDGFCSRACAAAARTGENHPRWVGLEGGYKTKHDRVKAVRGKAGHCSKCGLADPAITYHWANLTGDYDDIWDFAPMCPACHGAYDAHLQPRGSANHIAKLTEAIVATARRRFAAGESANALGREYGVSGVAMRNAITGRTWKHVGLEVAA
jgi:hypothetical protein